MKVVLSLAVLLTSALWADEAADRAAIGATIAELNTSPASKDIFTADFPNAADLQRFQGQLVVLDGIPIGVGTLVISREPMGEATWYPAASPAIMQRFVTRSVTFVSPGTAIVVATFDRQSVLFVVTQENSSWRIASFRALPEAQTKVR